MELTTSWVGKCNFGLLIEYEDEMHGLKAL